MKIKRWLLNRNRLVFGIAGLTVLLFLLYFYRFETDILHTSGTSTVFLDRNDIPMRFSLSKNDTRVQTCRLSEISPHFLRAIVLIEDKKFFSHLGVRSASIGRAFYQNVKNRRVVSGGSTITMQLAKLLHRHRKRHIFNKISEIFWALKCEVHVKKNVILEEYVNRLPFGNMIYGIKEASRYYFEKAPSRLSLNQAIYLALIPKSPTRYNPRKHEEKLRIRWNRVLTHFFRKGHISQDEYRRALNEGIRFEMNVYPLHAPHFIEMVKKRTLPGAETVRTTLDLGIQTKAVGIVREHLIRLKPYNVGSAAFVIIDNRTHEVVALMGSPDYFDERNSGFVNIAASLRQPGSTLKPFVYGLALEEGWTPATVLPDIRFPSKGGFFPRNHDGREHGPVRFRVALACSYNIPAFFLAMKLSPRLVIRKLHSAGFSHINGAPGFYGETIALGSGEVTLMELVTAYSSLANEGVIHEPSMMKGEPVLQHRLFSKHHAFLIWDILSDPSARFPSFGYHSSMNMPFPLAVKTGTSKGFRDKWAIGVNSQYTVGVWLGNPLGQNMKNLNSVGNATTVLRDIFLAIQKDWTKGGILLPDDIMKATICSLSGELATDACSQVVDEYFEPGSLPSTPCSYHLQTEHGIVTTYPELYKKWVSKNILSDDISFQTATRRIISFPQKGDTFYISEAISRQDQVIPIEVMGFESGAKVDIYLDGKHYREMIFPESVTWPLERGSHILEIRSGSAVCDTISFQVF